MVVSNEKTFKTSTIFIADPVRLDVTMMRSHGAAAWPPVVSLPPQPSCSDRDRVLVGARGPG